MAKIANVELTNTFDTWRTRSNQAFDRLSQFAVNNSSLYANTLTANVSFTSKGTTSLGDSAADTTTVNGLATFNHSVSVTKNVTISGNTSISGLRANSSYGSAGYFLRSNGTTAYWDALPPSTQYLQVANAITTYATKSNPTTSGLLDHTGRVSISTNLSVSGNTVSPTLTGTTTDRSNALSQTLTDGATVNWDTSLGRVATVTLGGSRTLAKPTNLNVGTYILKVVQGGSGSYNLTWNAAFKWTAQTAPTLSTAVGAVDVFSFFSDGNVLYGSFLPDVR